MEVIILDYTTTDIILISIPSDVEDVEDYLIENHGFHSSCYYMVANSLNITDKRSK